MANSVFSAQQIIDAIKEADGYVSKIASILGCSVQTVYNYRNKYPTVATAWHDVKERRHDFVENALHKRIKAGSDTAIIFYLKTQAKERGYIERQEVAHTLERELLDLFRTLPPTDRKALATLFPDMALPREGIEA